MSTGTWTRKTIVSRSTEGKLLFTSISGSFTDYTTQYFDNDNTGLTSAQLKVKGAFNDTSLFKRNT